MPTKNSLSTLLSDLIKVQKNGLEIVNKLSDVVSSKSDTVEIDILDENNVIKKVVIPSFGKLQSQIERLDQNVESLSGLGSSNSVLQLADGSFRKVLQDSLKKEANDIKTISTPTSFGSRANWFFESFLNPLLFVSFDFGAQIKSNTERVETARYILTLDTDKKLDFFEKNFQGKSNLDYDTFLNSLLQEGILFFLDQDVINLPPRDLKFYGTFSVIRILDNPITVTENGEEITKRDLKFKLDKLTYSDRDSRYINTQQLKINDSIVINSESRNTRYKITSIDEGTSTVSVELLEGFEKIAIGNDNLIFFGDNNAASLVEVNVGFNERTVMFIKPIDPDSEIKATNWSPGVGYFSNDLTIDDGNTTRTLDQYYKDDVVDFGAFLFSMAKEGTMPSILAEIPSSPLITASDFKVTQINKHITDTPVVDEIKKLHSEKVKLKNEISQFDVAINKKQSQLGNKKYKSKVERDADRNELNVLIEQRSSRSKLYASSVRDINTKTIESNITGTTPKYRLRGFWPLPEPKFSNQTTPQEVVQFEIQYRYVTKDGGANSADQIEFTEADGSTRRGSFSTWNEIKTPVRKRVTDPNTGLVSWIVEENENSDSVNINQLDLAIKGGEGIEFRIKSVSEAGYPANPAKSAYTEIIRVDFPDELESQISVDDITGEATKESVRIELQEDLETKGVYRHVSESTESNGRYFAHSGLELASGFVDEQQTPISMFEKIKSIQDELQVVRDLIERTKGQLNIRIIDESGNEYRAENNGKLYINAPNYKDEVSALTISKGVIITKTYFLTIENERSSEMELYSRIFGPVNRKPIASWDTSGSLLEGNYKYNGNNLAYNTEDRYDFVPILTDKLNISEKLTNTTGAPNPFATVRSALPFQSSQSLGQFINFRYSNIDGTSSLYSDIVGGTVSGNASNGSFTAIGATSVDDIESKFDFPTGTTGFDRTSNNFWITPLYGTTTGVNNISDVLAELNANTEVSDYDTSLGVHKLHPFLAIGAREIGYDSGINLGYSTILMQAAFPDKFRNTILAQQDSSSTNGNKQAGLFYDTTLDRGVKAGFNSEDQYLLGGLSCGAYFFPKMQDHEFGRVDGSSSKSVKKINFGNTKSLSIPLVFQYRMTDFFGDGITDEGLIGGRLTAKLDQLIYNKTLGIDVFYGLDERFSFDVTVTAKYKSNNLDVTDTPVKSFQNTINDLNDSLTTTLSSQPNISK